MHVLQEQSAAVKVVLSAEDFDGLTAPMRIETNSGASSGKAIRIPAKLPVDAPLTGQAKASVMVPEAGHYTIWFRVRWTGTCANSFTLSMPGFPDLTIGEDGNFDTWHWIKAPGPFNLKAGETTFTLKQREEDIWVDQVLLTKDASMIPNGIISDTR